MTIVLGEWKKRCHRLAAENEATAVFGFLPNYFLAPRGAEFIWDRNPLPVFCASFSLSGSHARPPFPLIQMFPPECSTLPRISTHCLFPRSNPGTKHIEKKGAGGEKLSWNPRPLRYLMCVILKYRGCWTENRSSGDCWRLWQTSRS